MNTLSTELDAVNVCLQSIGELPVNSLDGELPADAALAQTILHEVSRELQSNGWYWNTDYDYTFTRDDDGALEVPENVLHIDFPYSRTIEPLQRGSRLYDRKNHTYTFAENVKATRVTWFLPFVEMPEAARRYLAIRAARIFQARYLGSTQLNQETQDDEFRAWTLLQQDELRVEQPNMLDSPTVQSILLR